MRTFANMVVPSMPAFVSHRPHRTWLPCSTYPTTWIVPYLLDYDTARVQGHGMGEESRDLESTRVHVRVNT